MTLSSRGCQLLGRDDMVIATMSTSSIRHQGGDRNMLPRRPPRNFDNRTRGMSPRRPRTTHNSEDEDGMTFREATNTMRMHHTTGRRKIKDWTRHGKVSVCFIGAPILYLNCKLLKFSSFLFVGLCSMVIRTCKSNL